MSVKFNADEMLAIAEKIEINGALFYRDAAARRDNKRDREFLEQLAAMEDRHRETFAAMRAKLSPADRETDTFDPDNEADLYLATLVDLHAGEGDPTVRFAFTGKEAMGDVLRIAIGLERKSILFLDGLREIVSSKKGKAAIDDIIGEEKKHITELALALRKVGKRG